MTSFETSHATAQTDLTPAGIQPRALLARRRAIASGLNVATYLILVWAAKLVLVEDEITPISGLMLLAFLVAAPWSVLGFWNAVIGLWLLHGTRDGLARVAPFAAAAGPGRPIASRVAVVMTLRNEDPARAFARLKAVKDSIETTGEGRHFSYFVLSDTNEPMLSHAEEQAMAAWRAATPGDAERLFYRRRTENSGFKAGNLRDFCARWGADFPFMLPLDADSLMSGQTILELVRIGEAYPRLGILQSLVVGMPARSAFARIFQFGMRHGMRTYTMGNAWWAGDCGPFWGHNALVRVEPFMRHCDLPRIAGRPPLGGPILSHDQVEAALMRRAGYEVRVLPLECGSYEENPPTLLEFTRRDLRWCQGNLQYFWLLGMPGLEPMSRFQLLWAIMMFVGIPGWTLLIGLAAIKPLDGQDLGHFRSGLAASLYIAFLIMYLAPKLAGFLDIVLSQGELARYGGGLRFCLGVVTELVFSFLLGAVTTLRTGLFMIGLVFGRSIVWGGQARDAHALSWRSALIGLWPQTLFGLLLAGAFWTLTPRLIVWALPLTIGYLTAAPFAVASASSAVGALLERWKLCAIPEDFRPPPEIRAVQADERKPI
jgi:membrane glycosyltransferase